MLANSFGVFINFFHAPFVNRLHNQDFAFAGGVVHMKSLGIGVFEFRDLQIGNHARFHGVIGFADHRVEVAVLFALTVGDDHHAGDGIGPDTGVAFFVRIETEHAVAREFHAGKGAREIADEPEAARLHAGYFHAGAFDDLAGDVMHF